MIGVRRIRQQIRERFIRINVQSALGKGLAVCADFPDLEVGGAVLRMLCRRNKLQVSVVVKVCHGVEPPDQAVGLLHFLGL